MLRRIASIFMLAGALLMGTAAAAEAPPPPGSEASPAPGAPPVVPSVLEVHADGGDWSCSIDGEAPLAPDSSHVLVASVTAGTHLVTCERPNAQPFQTSIKAVPGNRVVIQAEFKPDPQQPSAPIEESQLPSTTRNFELRVGAGFSPAYGVFGIGIGFRYRHFGIDAGTGTYPWGAGATYYFSPGATGFYLTAGYLRIGHGLVVGGADVTGSEVYGGAGLDIRLLMHMSLKVGLGGGYEFNGSDHWDGRGPIVFEITAVWNI